jgi:hypothetical protein
MDRIVAGASSWAIRLSVTNRTGVPLLIERPHVTGGALIGIAFFRTAARSEVEERARVRRFEPQLVAERFAPLLPPALLDGKRWRGSASGRGRLPRGVPLRLVVGRFVVRGDVPRGLVEQFVCVSERVVRL